MIRLLGDRIFATEDGLIRHIVYVDAACSLFKDKLRQLPLLIYSCLLYTSVLGIGHDGDFLYDFHHLLSDCKKLSLSIRTF